MARDETSKYCECRLVNYSRGALCTWLRSIVFVTWLTLSTFSVAACDDASKFLAQRLATLENSTKNSGMYFTRAGYYLDAGCLDRAKDELKLADSALNNEKFSVDDKNVRRAAQAGLRTYIECMELLASGDALGARTRLLALLQQSYATDVMWRTTIALGELIVDAPENDWLKYSSYLDSLASGGDFWQVDFIRRQRQVSTGRISSAIATVLRDLDNDLPIQRHLALQVLLIELLLSDKQNASARIRCTQLDRTVGEELFDIQLRLRFLVACGSAWKQFNAVGGDPVASRNVRLFDAAVARFRLAM